MLRKAQTVQQSAHIRTISMAASFVQAGSPLDEYFRGASFSLCRLTTLFTLIVYQMSSRSWRMVSCQASIKATSANLTIQWVSLLHLVFPSSCGGAHIAADTRQPVERHEHGQL